MCCKNHRRTEWSVNNYGQGNSIEILFSFFFFFSKTLIAHLISRGYIRAYGRIWHINLLIRIRLHRGARIPYQLESVVHCSILYLFLHRNTINSWLSNWDTYASSYFYNCVILSLDYLHQTFEPANSASSIWKYIEHSSYTYLKLVFIHLFYFFFKQKRRVSLPLRLLAFENMSSIARIHTWSYFLHFLKNKNALFSSP